jgi:hypothetical protein
MRHLLHEAQLRARKAEAAQVQMASLQALTNSWGSRGVPIPPATTATTPTLTTYTPTTTTAATATAGTSPYSLRHGSAGSGAGATSGSPTPYGHSTATYSAGGSPNTTSLDPSSPGYEALLKQCRTDLAAMVTELRDVVGEPPRHSTSADRSTPGTSPRNNNGYRSGSGPLLDSAARAAANAPLPLLLTVMKQLVHEVSRASFAGSSPGSQKLGAKWG